MNMGEVTGWVEAHPTESIVIGGAAVIALLWVFGAFGSSAAASSSGSSNLASAYYAAEAQQAVVGGQIQMATIAATAATAQAGIQAHAATAINAAQTKAAVTINGQNAGAAMTINQSSNDLMATQASYGYKTAATQADYAYRTAATVSSNQLQATQSNNQFAYLTQASHDTAATTMNAANNATLEYNNFVSTILPTEFAKSNNVNVSGPGLGVFSTSAGGPSGVASLAQLTAAGFSPSEIDVYHSINGGL